MISSYKEKYEELAYSAAVDMEQAAARMEEANALKKDRQRLINEASDKKAAEITKGVRTEYERQSLKREEEYMIKMLSLEAGFVFWICYGVLTTLFRGVQSDRFMNDVTVFMNWIWNYIYSRFMQIYELAVSAWRINEDIPYPVIDVLFGGLLAGIIFVFLFAIFYIIPAGSIGLLTYLYVSRIGDLLSASVALAAFAVIVYFADNMTAITWNLVLIWFLVQGIYVVARSICVYFRMYH